jgi:serine/threonine protein kinase
MAPELIMTGTYPCGTKCDVFSFGIVVWSLLVWQEPYADLQASHSVFELLSRITTQGLRPKVNEGTWPPGLVDWYSNMVETDPDRRPSFAELLKALDADLGDDVRAAWTVTVARTYANNWGNGRTLV